MTKPQIWVASFLVLFIILFIIGRLTKEKEPVKNIPQGEVTNETSPENLTAEEMIVNFGCVNCHGQELQGTIQGPALKNLSQYYSRKDLISYLRNPQSFMSSARLREYREQFPNVMMPNFSNKNIKDLGKLADYLLGRK
jgi:mono/diheme cytochrome c family protein